MAFIDIKLPTLSKQQLTSLNNPFSIDEIAKVIAALPNSKSPGSDGLTDEYYKEILP